METAIGTIYLAGNPNCGKSSLFNLLAGLNQKISNIPGTTVEKVKGKLKLKGKNVSLIDLPGAYSLSAKSEDERVASKELLEAKNAMVVFVADATRLESNLSYFAQISDLGLPTILVLNMFDLAKSKGIVLDVDALSRELGVLVVTTSARNNTGIEKLKETMAKLENASQSVFWGNKIKTPLSQTEVQNYRNRLHKAIESPEDEREKANWLEESICRKAHIQDIIQKVRTIQAVPRSFIHKLDTVLLHPIWGLASMFVILFVIFQAVFYLAEWPMQAIEWFFSRLGIVLQSSMNSGWLRDILVNGVVSGLAGIVVFLPQIIILFFFIGLMEETGYMTRVSFLSDRFMRRFGLNGKSVIPLVGGMACAIPSIMAARSIENKKEKLITILVTPLMSCSARLPVYTLLISLLVSPQHKTGVFHTGGLILMGMYVLGFVSALLFSLIFNFFVKSKSKEFFIMEVPELKPPRWQALFVTLYTKAMSFLMGAGKVILAVSILLFFLMQYGPNQTQRDKLKSEFEAKTLASEDEQATFAKSMLETSYIGKFGKIIEPAISPLGYDWKIGIALLTSFAAREVFVGTMSVIYGVADDPEGVGLREKLRSEKDPKTGKPIYSIAVLVSLMIFYAFAMQCMSTLAIVYKETNSLKWPMVQLLSMTGTAYLLSFVAYQLLS